MILEKLNNKMKPKKSIASLGSRTEMLSPSYSVLNCQVSSVSLWELLVKVHMGFKISTKKLIDFLFIVTKI